MSKMNNSPYTRLARAAAQAEAEGFWNSAEALWAKAARAATKAVNAEWAGVRSQYCINARERKWEACNHAGERV